MFTLQFPGVSNLDQSCLVCLAPLALVALAFLIAYIRNLSSKAALNRLLRDEIQVRANIEASSIEVTLFGILFVTALVIVVIGFLLLAGYRNR